MPSASAPSLRVLVVVGNDDEYRWVSDLLAAGSAPEIIPLRAIGPQEGLHALTTAAPDLCLVADPLGDPPGAAFLCLAHEQGVRVPIILLVGESSADREPAALAAGVAGCLPKAGLTAPLLDHAICHALCFHRLQDMLRESEDRYRTLLDQAADGILVADSQGRLVEVNATACAMLGYPREDLLRLGVSDIIAVDASGAPARLIDLQAGKTVWVEGLLKRRDGTSFPAEISAKMLDGGRFQGMVRDITARKQLDASIRAGERLEALGRVAAGVAHEFNNILAGILGRLDLLALQTQDADQAATLQAIQQTVDEGAALVRRIQTFARLRNPATFIPVPLAGLVNEVVALTGPRWRALAGSGRPAVAVLTQLEHGLMVSGSPDELREALTNLILNAVDALPLGGQIIINTEQQDHDAVLTIRDTGTGIAPSVQDRLFEPFVTTKVSGSGLGLAVVKDIVQGHGGTIAVVSQAGMGTLFTIRLPLYAAEPANLAAPFVSAAPSAVPAPSALPAAADARAIAPSDPLDVRRLAHDLRGPLTYLVGYAELLHTRDLPPASVKQMAGEVLQQAQRLAGLVEKLQS